MTRFSRVDENFSQDFLSVKYAGLPAPPPQTSFHVSVDEAVTMFTLIIRKRARNRTGLTSALGRCKTFCFTNDLSCGSPRASNPRGDVTTRKSDTGQMQVRRLGRTFTSLTWTKLWVFKNALNYNLRTFASCSSKKL